MLFNQALKNIYEELVDVKDGIEPNLFKATFETLNKAVDKGFGSISYNHPDFDFVNELKANNGVFAAFKTHRQQNDLAKQLLDDNGNLKTFDQFRKDTESIIGEYNRNWLRTEYDTAVIRARMAARFKEFQRDADLYPNLKWTPSTSVDKRELHVSLYGLILPITHPFWLQQYPGSLWNCKCGITNTDEAENSAIYHLDKYDIPTPPAGLEGNPAFTGKIFSDNNAYRQNAYPGAGKSVSLESDRLLRDYSRKVVRAYFEELLKKPLTFKMDMGDETVKVHVTWQDIKELTGKPHKFGYMRNTCTYFLPEIVKSAKYIKPAKDAKAAKHYNKIESYHYWEFDLNYEKSYLIVEKLKSNGEYHLHAIQDQDHFK